MLRAVLALPSVLLLLTGCGSHEWSGVSVPVSGDSTSVRFERRSAHPFLAEYDRRLRLANGSIVDLPMNPGGRTLIHVYSRRDEHGPALHLHDRWGHYVVRLEAMTVEIYDNEQSQVPTSFGEYIGRLDGTTAPLRFVPAQKEPPADTTGMSSRE